MDEKTISEICAKIAKKIPEVQNSIPKIHVLPNGNREFIFKSTEKTQNGHTLHFIVRATIDIAGNIIKLSTSR
jgi:hypothetical protein